MLACQIFPPALCLLSLLIRLGDHIRLLVSKLIMMQLYLLIRDSCGAIMLSSLKSLEESFSHAVAEAWALLYRMQLASEAGLLPTVVESDSSSVINLFLSRSSIRAEIGLVFDDILTLRDSFDFVNFVFSPMSTNKVTHSLAKMALVHDVDLILMEEVPPGLSRLVKEEATFSLLFVFSSSFSCKKKKKKYTP
ncbi:hypothetical protein ACOSQ2_016543 [Xanthoceras sorbifolium]